MRIYKEVLIESAEQAEALPYGTQRLQDGREGLAVGFTALVPIQVKEVNVVAQGILEYDMNGCVVLEQANQPIAKDYKRTEFHTAWRPA